MKIHPSRLWPALVVFLVALLFRLGCFLQIRAGFPAWDFLTLDPRFHDSWARRIASGELTDGLPFFRAPFYGYFLGGIYAVFGPGLAVPLVIQHLLGALACAVLFLLADRYLGRRHAWTVGLLGCFAWILVFFEDQLLLDSLLVLYSVALTWLLLWAAEGHGGKRFFLAGLLLGLAAVTRPNFLILLPAVGLWLVFLFAPNRRRTVGSLGFLMVGTVVLVLPVFLHNLVSGRDTVLISSQGGLNFYIGNNARADGSSAVVPELGPTWKIAECEALAQIESGRSGRPLKPSEVSRYYFARGLRFVREDPLAWLKLTLKKFLLFWNPYEITNNRNPYFFRQFAPVSKFFPDLFFLIAPLAMLGLGLVFSGPRRFHLVAYLVIFYMFSVVLFFVNSRFRLPVLPLLILLASVTFWRLVDLARGRRLASLARHTALLLALVVITNVDWYGVSRDSFAKSHYSLGLAHYERGDKQQALAEYREAAALDPGLPNVYLNQGVVFLDQGDSERAKASFEREIRSWPDNPEAHLHLSVLEATGGNIPGALGHAERAVALRPYSQKARVQQLIVLDLGGQREAALSAAERFVGLFPESPPGFFFRGKTRFDLGQIVGAEADLNRFVGGFSRGQEGSGPIRDLYSGQESVLKDPDRQVGQAYYLLGLIGFQKGEMAEARDSFRRAVELNPAHADSWGNLGVTLDQLGQIEQALACHERATELRPDQERFWFNLGITLGKAGRFDAAREAFGRALIIAPDFAEAREKLSILEAMSEAGPGE